MVIQYDKLPSELGAHGMAIYASALSSDEGPQIVGSCVLGRLNGNYFLITAAHVIEDPTYEHPCILAPDSGGFLPISELKKPKIISKERDLFIAELDGRHLEETRNWRKFIDLGTHNRDPLSSEIAVGASVGFVGFPSTKNPAIRISRHTTPVIPEPKGYLIVCEHAEPNKPSYHGYDPSVHIVAHFCPRDYQKADGMRVTAPNPTGMSGGGVWLLCDDDRENGTISHYHLIGVGIRSENNLQSLVAVRFEHVVCALDDHWANTIPA
jgi:hypothetical protein